MKKLFLLLAIVLGGCFGQTTYIGDPTLQTKYGEECFEKPYINKYGDSYLLIYGDSYLCQANAISKLNKQVEIHNKAIQ